MDYDIRALEALFCTVSLLCQKVHHDTDLQNSLADIREAIDKMREDRSGLISARTR